MKTFPADLTILTPRATLSGADDSIASINTTEYSDGAIVMLKSNYTLYQLRKGSTDAQSLPNIVAPAQGGPGRWHRLAPGSPVAIQVAFPAIGPNTTVEGGATVPGKQSQGDLVLANVTDSGLPTGVGLVNVRPSASATTAAFRFMNATGATIAGQTVSLLVSVIPA